MRPQRQVSDGEHILWPWSRWLFTITQGCNVRNVTTLLDIRGQAGPGRKLPHPWPGRG